MDMYRNTKCFCGCCCCSCVAILLMMLLLFAAVHSTPATRGCSSYKQQCSSTYCQSFFLYERTYFSAPLGSGSALYGLPILHTSHGHYGHARSRRRASARREAPLVYNTKTAVVAWYGTWTIYVKKARAQQWGGKQKENVGKTDNLVWPTNSDHCTRAAGMYV